MAAELSPLRGTRPAVLSEFFEHAARRWPDAVAVDVPPAAGRPQRRTISYAELERRSGLLSDAVSAVDPGGVAAILLSRSTELPYVAQLAALCSTSAHVCIDPAFPDAQIRHVLRDSTAGALLTDAEGAERARRVGYQGPVLRVDRPHEPTARASGAPAPESVAYIIYTSGSTGTPKGVLISHASAANLIRGDLAEFDLGPGDRVAQGSSPAYDSAVEEMWMALASGATVVVLDDETARLGPDLVPWLHRERITVLCPPPTLLRATGCEDPQQELPDLRLLYVGGEALPEDVAERWSRGRRMVNGYGPTECTVTCLRQDIVAGRQVAIGRPVPGMRAWVLDENLQPVPDGHQGELCLGGAGLAIGYLNHPELNSDRFPPHERLGRIYRTGDLVHREPDGRFHCHGRIDAQVKLRGYRIELEAIESCLTRCPGVREVACRVQRSGDTETLAAHVVPADPARPPHAAELKRQLRRWLPAYMVPSLVGTIDELPRNASGKLRRDDLPALSVDRTRRPPAATTPRDARTNAILDAVRQVLALPDEPALDDDFFDDLGGSSLGVAELVTRLRADPQTASLTARDVYEARTVGQLVLRVAPPAVEPDAAPSEQPAASAAGATAVQASWLALELVVAAEAAYLVVFRLLPWLSHRIGLIPLILLAPFLLTGARVVTTPLAIAVAVRVKKVLIGRYTPARVPVWSGLHVRMWFVRQFIRLVPWRTIAGTEFQCMALRALGARIGRRVHLHRGVDLVQGGWDLLDIGDDVTISQDASLGLVHLEQGHVVLGPISVADGAVLDVRAGLAPGTRLGRRARLTALSYLPAGGAIPEGQRWDGIPAQPAGRQPAPPTPADTGRRYRPLVHGVAMILSQNLLGWLLALPYTVAFVLVVAGFELTYPALLAALAHPSSNPAPLVAIGAATCLALVCGTALEAVAARAVGAVRTGVISRWSASYLRVWLKTGLVASSGRWLSGGLFWPVWLRAAGMRVGRDCEISTIIDTVPELVDIGSSSFLADGIYLGGPRIQQGTVTLGNVVLERDTFLGNHAVVRAGQRLPAGILLGIATVADDARVRPGTSWFGHPPLELPRREIVTADPAVTHHPPLSRVVTRIFWEWLRFTLPIVPLLSTLLWVFGMSHAMATMPFVLFLTLGAPAVTVAAAAFPLLFVLGLKWALLGRVREGTHPLWSCWCSRWDFLYVAWSVIAGGLLAALEGTLLLPLYLRRTGMEIGREVVLGEGFAQVVDPDMLHIGDRATVSAMFQAHTFEDRVLKIGHVRVGAHSTLGLGTVPLYGSEVGAHTWVAPHSVIMKHERLQPGRRYEGAPTGCV